MRVEIQEKELFKSLIYKNFNMELNNINGICTDSREVEQGDIFIPIKGERLDPHQFIPNVIEKKPSIIFSEIKFQSKNIIKVESTKKTLKKLSSDWVDFFKAPIIAITGSNGKTTTKEMLNNIFSSICKTNYTRGNYNSSIGLPINLFEFCLDAKVSILEMGANKANEIDYLCQIAKPYYSLITNIQNAHIGNFNSLNDLINTKISIFKNTDKNGKIFENLDDINIVNNSADKQNKVQFSFKDCNVDFFGEFKTIKEKNYFFINGKEIFNTQLNKIMAQNMLASYSIATVFGIDHKIIKKAFQKFQFLKGRGEQIKKNGYLIVDDTYNANFESFQLGINSFMKINCKGKKILIIGDMKELGSKSKQYHSDLGKYINTKQPNIVFSFGNLIHETIYQIKNKKIISEHFKTIDSLIDNLKSILNKGDAIYLKASRSMKFENIIDKI